MSQTMIRQSDKWVKRLLPFYLFSLLLSLSSCSEVDNTVEEYDNWLTKNTVFVASLATDSMATGNFVRYKSWNYDASIAGGDTEYIYVKEEIRGSGTECPEYTDTVLVHYSGRLLPSLTHTDGYRFDASFEGTFSPDTSLPARFALNSGSLINGFITALMHMHVGDTWTVYIPYTLGYGVTTSGSIPAYSTLIFQIQLAEIKKLKAVTE